MSKTKYTKELLTSVVIKSNSISQVLDFLGLKFSGGSHRLIKSWVEYWHIDTSHFSGKVWNKGKTKYTDSSLMEASKKMRLSNEEVFIENSRPVAGYRIKSRLLDLGWKEECFECRLPSIWNNKKLVLQLDHINGIHYDNRLENLRLLCPNCHSQTSSFCSKNRVSLKNMITNYCKCGKKILARSKACSECCNKNRAAIERISRIPRKTKIEWPAVEDLIRMVEEKSYSAVGRDLGVSDNAVKKHIEKNKNPT
jgi:hypothetical protein